MRTAVELVDDSGDSSRLRELGTFFAELRDANRSGQQVDGVAAPGWLASAFAPERSAAEAQEWLARWRAAADKLAFERASGWTAANWFHWFSPGNEFWSLADVAFDEDTRRLTLYLDHEDEPIPMEVLKWLAVEGNLEIRGVVRLQ